MKTIASARRSSSPPAHRPRDCHREPRRHPGTGHGSGRRCSQQAVGLVVPAARGFPLVQGNARGNPDRAGRPTQYQQTCSVCGHCERGNRKSQAEFACKQCGQSFTDPNLSRSFLAVPTTIRTGDATGRRHSSSLVGCKIIASRALFNPVDTRTEPFHSRILTGFGRARLLPSLFISPRLRTGSADHPSGGAPSPSRENETALRPGSPDRLPRRQRKRRGWPVLRVPESRFSPESGSFACNSFDSTGRDTSRQPIHPLC